MRNCCMTVRTSYKSGLHTITRWLQRECHSRLALVPECRIAQCGASTSVLSHTSDTCTRKLISAFKSELGQLDCAALSPAPNVEVTLELAFASHCCEDVLPPAGHINAAEVSVQQARHIMCALTDVKAGASSRRQGMSGMELALSLKLGKSWHVHGTQERKQLIKNKMDLAFSACSPTLGRK